MRVIIAGAGDLGLQLLRGLSDTNEHEVVVVEVDEQLAENLAADFDALVIAGDAADPDILEKAQIREADALVAVTGSDPINAIIAMLGHRLDVERIIVKLTSNALRGALAEIGVTDVVAPTMAAASRIAAVLHGGRDEDLRDLVPGGLEISEVTVGTHGAGQTIGGLTLPDDVLLVAVIHGDDSSLPHPDVALEEGDVVVAIAETEDALGRCRELLGDG